MRLRLRKSEILRGRGRFVYVARRGKRLRGQFVECSFLAVRGRPVANATGLCVGFRVGKETGNATRRNRIRRQMRESYRLHRMDSLAPATMKTGSSIEIVIQFPRRGYRPVVLPSFREIEQDIVTVMLRMAEMVGEQP